MDKKKRKVVEPRGNVVCLLEGVVGVVSVIVVLAVVGAKGLAYVNYMFMRNKFCFDIGFLGKWKPEQALSVVISRKCDIGKPLTRLPHQPSPNARISFPAYPTSYPILAPRPCSWTRAGEIRERKSVGIGIGIRPNTHFLRFMSNTYSGTPQATPQNFTQICGIPIQ